MGGPGPFKAGGLGPQSVRRNTLEGQCRGPGPAPKSGPGPLRGDSWGKEKLEEKMGMDATAARGKGVLWCPGQAANSIARGKSALNSPWREAYQRSHTHPGHSSREPQLQQADDCPSQADLTRGARMMARQVLCIRAQVLLGLLPGIAIFAIGILLAVDERLLLLNYGERQTCEGVALSFNKSPYSWYTCTRCKSQTRSRA